MKTLNRLIISLFILTLIAAPVAAKDLKGNLGLGFNSQLSPRDVDSLSAKYWLNNELAVQGIVGFNYTDETDELDLGGKVFFKIKDEENLHVDAIAGLGFARVDPEEGDTDTATWMNVGIGIEYFFQGLPNLGFSTEIGLTIMDYDDDTSFGTNGESFIGAGIHYYFDFLAPSVKKPAETEE